MPLLRGFSRSLGRLATEPDLVWLNMDWSIRNAIEKHGRIQSPWVRRLEFNREVQAIHCSDSRLRTFHQGGDWTRAGPWNITENQRRKLNTPGFRHSLAMTQQVALKGSEVRLEAAKNGFNKFKGRETSRNGRRGMEQALRSSWPPLPQTIGTNRMVCHVAARRPVASGLWARTGLETCMPKCLKASQLPEPMCMPPVLAKVLRV